MVHLYQPSPLHQAQGASWERGWKECRRARRWGGVLWNAVVRCDADFAVTWRSSQGQPAFQQAKLIRSSELQKKKKIGKKRREDMKGGGESLERGFRVNFDQDTLFNDSPQRRNGTFALKADGTKGPLCDTPRLPMPLRWMKRCLRGGKHGGVKWALLLFVWFHFNFFFFWGWWCKGEGRTSEELGNKWNWGAWCEILKESIKKLC